MADLSVDESVGDEPTARELEVLGNRLEAARMVAVAVEDLVALGSVHDWAIGRTANAL